MCNEIAESRNQKIYTEFLNGATCDELSREYSVSSVRIREIVKNEKRKEEYQTDELYRLIQTLTDDRKNATRVYTLLSRLNVHLKEEVLEIDRERLKKLRNCGSKMEELIMKLKEVIEKDMG